MKRPLRIGINAQFSPGMIGGVETAVTELISALGRLSETERGEEEYVIVGLAQQHEWLRPFTKGNQKVVPGTPPLAKKTKSSLDSLKEATGPLRPALGRVRTLLQPGRRAAANQAALPCERNFFETLACDVIHFPYQAFFSCGVPTIYNPHDLQHLHFPEFYSTEEIKNREALYRRGCRLSHTVVVGSPWIARDLREKYGVPNKRLQVVPWAAPLGEPVDLSETTLRTVRQKYGLEKPFALYPAATWEHKNHLRLLEAVYQLRSAGEFDLTLTCTGEQTPHYEQIQSRHRTLGLEETVRFLGRIPSAELRALYRMASFVIIPTLFEAASGPLFEAWRDEVPVACSHVTSLPHQAGKAALLFDPFSVGAIATALRRLQTDAELRAVLRRRGNSRLCEFSWDRTARAYRSVYRRAAGRRLSEEEQDLLSSMNAADET